MNFTREPIIETVITPREGCKLVVRNSKGVGQEDYFVDAVEVVSFGHSFFFRSLERPKSFLVPVSDYEILELKETRMVLKNVASERSIKIGGGRETPVRRLVKRRKKRLPVQRARRNRLPLPSCRSVRSATGAVRAAAAAARWSLVRKRLFPKSARTAKRPPSSRGWREAGGGASLVYLEIVSSSPDTD